MLGTYEKHLQATLSEIQDSGLYKNERIITSAQGPRISVASGAKVLNFCANNYLNLAAHPEIIAAAKESFDEWGYGLASVRFICGTQAIHKTLEKKLSDFLGMDETILYTSCFDANTGLFETLLTKEDAIISDALNHASIIDGVRLCKAKRYRFDHADMAALEDALKEAQAQRFRLIATDGVFSMDGDIANLAAICDLAEKYDALVMVDDSHSVGFMGKTGRGTHEHCEVMGRVDILTGTLGKALGGASGGYTSARRDIVDLLRQRSRPYLFSNTVAPGIVAAAIKTLELLSASTELRDRLEENTKFFREKIAAAGFSIREGTHPIVAIMFGDAAPARQVAEVLLTKGIYVVGFWYPVVPQGAARIRVQISAGHTQEDLLRAIAAFTEAKAELGL